METSRPEGVKQEMRGRKLKSGVNWRRGCEAERPQIRTISSQLHVPAALSLKNSHDVCRTGGWVGPKASLNTLENKKSVAFYYNRTTIPRSSSQ
jgi:hypothetical protein